MQVSWQMEMIRKPMEMIKRRCVGEAEEALFAILMVPWRRRSRRDVLLN